jgi:hypothetical protein
MLIFRPGGIMPEYRLSAREWTPPNSKKLT